MLYPKYSALMSIYIKEKPEFFRKSILSMVEQTIKPDEIVIVKDGPLTEALDEVIDEFKYLNNIKIVALPTNKGLGEALNIGIKNCKNNIIARMDTDDISVKDRCEKQLELFINDPELSIVGSSVAEFHDNINKIDSIRALPTIHEDIVKYSKRRNPFNHPSVMYKKDEVNKAGGYKHFSYFEDYYLWARMIMNNAKCANIKEPLVFMRANDDMFKRRGGNNYLKCILSFKWHLKEIGFFSLKDFLASAIIHSLVAVSPNKLRIYIYRKFLRKASND